MKIELRIVCPADANDVLEQDETIANTVNLKAGVIDIDSEDELLDRILYVTRDTSGIWFNPGMSFTRAEVAQSRYFQLECRKVVNETNHDYELNSSRLDEVELIQTTDQCKIKLLDKVALSRIKIKPNIVAGIDQWTAEFLITSTVANIFEQEQLTGLSLRPIFNPKTRKDHKEYLQLYTENIMPPVEHDLTIYSLEKEIPEEGGFRELGCLTYDFREVVPKYDFNRTAENFSSNFMPFWVVSARVRECFVRNKLRGWAFRPVIEKGSEFQNAYLAKWQSLFDRISINPLNHF